MRYPLRRRFERLASDRWARRALRILLRSAWLGLSIVCIGLGLQMLLGLSIPLEYLGAAALICVALGGALLLLRRRLSAQEVARRLDTRFDLNDQLSTALEVSTRSDAEGVALRLLDQAQATTIQVQRQIAEHRRHPWPELLAVLALLLVGGGLLLMLGLGPPGPTPAAEPLPPLAEPPQANEQDPAQDQQQQQSEQAQSQGQQQSSQTLTEEMSGYDQQSAAALADALRDQSATRPAADELDQGNIGGAAQELRELADQAEQLSGETRRNLADELRSAASQIEPDRPDMADQLRESAYGLQQEGPSSAEALENLANTVEQLGQGGMQEEQAQGQQGEQGQVGQQGQQGSGGSAGDSPPPGEQREQSHERLGVDGVPLELESDGEGNTPSEGEPETTSAGGGTFTSGQEAVDETTVQVGEDPLSIPADLRDVVQEYFSAPETE
jgi:hypothetical protein